jgi:hypothetical protein
LINACLNNDLKVSTTVALKEDDKRKVSLSTPKSWCSEAIQRSWDFGLAGKAGKDKHKGGVPCESRVVQDITGAIDSYKAIHREAHHLVHNFQPLPLIFGGDYPT